MKTLAAKLAVCAVVASSLSLPLLAAGPQTVVAMNMTEFQSPTLSIAPGATVLFQNHDTMPHEVVSTEGDVFDLKLQKPGETTSHIFKTAGVFSITCALHTKMKMTITVK